MISFKKGYIESRQRFEEKYSVLYQLILIQKNILYRILY